MCVTYCTVVYIQDIIMYVQQVIYSVIIKERKKNHYGCVIAVFQSEDGIDQGVTLVYPFYTKQRIGIKIEANADLLVVRKEA